MSKRKRKSVEQPPPPKDHSPAQVKEVALMLYAQQPFEIRGAKSALQWHSLVWRANVFLDTLNEVCEAVARQRQAVKEIADLDLPDVSPFDKAMKVITRQQKLQRALERFETLPLTYPRYFGGAFGNWPTKRQWRKQIARWRENGMKREEVIELRALWDENDYRRYRIATAGRAKKRRAPWSDKKRIKAQLESSARELERQRKVDAARRLARGEIE
jgi:hypothetical protein